jgi:hypothetical protein
MKATLNIDDPSATTLFKRNQVEEAIARVLEPGSAKLSSKMRTRLKRLLVTDRALGRSKRSVDPERANFAFSGIDVLGRGLENRFTGYEAFALLTGLRLMVDSWPQGLVVAALRRVKPDLEQHHARILSQNPTILFDADGIRQQARPGDLLASTDPVFLAINAKDREHDAGTNRAAICQSQAELMRFIKTWGPGQTWTVTELGTSIHALALALAKTVPRKRGRGGQLRKH